MVRPRSAPQHPESWDPHRLPATQSTPDGKVSQSVTTSAFLCRKKEKYTENCTFMCHPPGSGRLLGTET